MPQLFRIGSYCVYFWSNEGKPIEPVHVHVSCGAPTEYGSKIWITSRGRAYLDHNRSRIPANVLRSIMRIIEARSDEIISEWEEHFGEVRYFF